MKIRKGDIVNSYNNVITRGLVEDEVGDRVYVYCSTFNQGLCKKENLYVVQKRNEFEYYYTIIKKYIYNFINKYNPFNYRIIHKDNYDY